VTEKGPQCRDAILSRISMLFLTATKKGSFQSPLEVLTLSGLRFHHLIIPIAAAMVAIGLAVIKASRSLGILEILGPDLVLAIGSVLIVFGVFCIASYGLVRAIEWADQGISREERTQASSKGKSERLR
jgi:hypothetical protein